MVMIFNIYDCGADSVWSPITRISRTRQPSLSESKKSLWPQLDAVDHPTDEETAFVEQHAFRSGYSVTARTLPVYGFRDFAENDRADLELRAGVLFVASFNRPSNIFAAVWFVREVLPSICREAPGIKLYLVGDSPSTKVHSLASPNVVVTGFVPEEELERHYASARVVVAPLRSGGGMKGKVVEAMRFGVPVVTTGEGAKGLGDGEGALLVSDAPNVQADLVLRLMRDDDFWLESRRLPRPSRVNASRLRRCGQRLRTRFD